MPSRDKLSKIATTAALYRHVAHSHFHLAGIAALLLVVATFVLAYFTYRLAHATKEVVDQNKSLLEKEDRHHMDNLRPYCVLEVIDYDVHAWESWLFAAKDIIPLKSMQFCVMLNCRITNKGLGAAFNIRIGADGGAEPCEAQHILGCLEAGGHFSISQPGYKTKEMVPLFLSRSQLQGDKKPDIKVYLEYSDMFGRRWRSDHTEVDPGFLRVEFTSLNNQPILVGPAESCRKRYP